MVYVFLFISDGTFDFPYSIRDLQNLLELIRFAILITFSGSVIIFEKKRISCIFLFLIWRSSLKESEKSSVLVLYELVLESKKLMSYTGNC